MMIDSNGLLGQLSDFAAASGHFGNVLKHEPKAAPTTTPSITCAVWFNDMASVNTSGMAALSMRLSFTVRLYLSMMMEPQDDIDPMIMGAMDSLFTQLAGNFTLDGRARYVDSLGSDGDRLRATAGYLTQDTKPFRIVDIMVPIIVNDSYTESA